MPYTIKGLSRFFCACARCPALFLHQEPHRMRHAVRALTSSLDRQVSLIVRPWCLSPLLKRVDLAFIERGCHTVLLGPACAFKQKVTVSPWKKPIVPLATAHEKGYDGSLTTARRRPMDSSATSLPTVGPGCSEAPPSVAPLEGSTQERFCMKRVSRAGS